VVASERADEKSRQWDNCPHDYHLQDAEGIAGCVWRAPGRELRTTDPFVNRRDHNELDKLADAYTTQVQHAHSAREVWPRP